MKTFKLDIFTPYGHYLTDNVTFLQVSSEEYNLGILPDHAPLVSTVKICKLVIERNGQKEEYAISGGVIKVEKNNVNLLVDAIESKDEIDLQRAESSKERAENRLINQTVIESIDVTRAKLSLERALNRIHIKKGIN